MGGPAGPRTTGRAVREGAICGSCFVLARGVRLRLFIRLPDTEGPLYRSRALVIEDGRARRQIILIASHTNVLRRRLARLTYS